MAIPRLKNILITTGDVDGIGFEVTAKALYKLGPQKGLSFVVWRGPKVEKKWSLLLKKKFNLIAAPSLSDALELASSPCASQKSLIEIISSESPALWVEQSAQACFKNKSSGLVTGPLSKPEIITANKARGYRDLGHTEILKRVTRSNMAIMSFWGKHFRVLLTTGHIPLSQVESQLTEERLSSVLSLALKAQQTLPRSLAKKPIGILGLNPHSGDQGLIGSFEQTLLKPWIEKQRKSGVKITDPLVPDVAFHKDNWSKFSFYIALYHDQGLIPFKTVHGFSGVHVTLGLPLVRSSVDHGTAKDLFGRGKADPSSMIDAIQWAIKAAKN